MERQFLERQVQNLVSKCCHPKVYNLPTADRHLPSRSVLAVGLSASTGLRKAITPILGIEKEGGLESFVTLQPCLLLFRLWGRLSRPP